MAIAQSWTLQWDALIDEVVLFNDGHYEVKLKYRDEMEELLLNAALWQKEAQRYA